MINLTIKNMMHIILNQCYDISATDHQNDDNFSLTPEEHCFQLLFLYVINQHYIQQGKKVTKFETGYTI